MSPFKDYAPQNLNTPGTYLEVPALENYLHWALYSRNMTYIGPVKAGTYYTLNTNPEPLEPEL